MHVSRRTSVLFALLLALGWGAARVDAQSSHTVFINLEGLQAGNIADTDALIALEAALRQLGALPESAEPTIIQIHAVDSRYALLENASGAARLREQSEVIRSVVSGREAPVSIFVATPWGTPENRIADGQMMGRPTPYFPTTDQELATAGFDWLTTTEDLVLRWDGEGELAEIVAPRHTIRGNELLGPVRMVLCANRESILGWARSQRTSSPTPAGLGRFVEQCVGDGLEAFGASYQLPGALLEEQGVAGTRFAVLIVDAYAQPVPVSQALAAARSLLDETLETVPLIVVAGETLTPDLKTVVTARDHHSALLELGVEVDEDFSAALPTWAFELATHAATTLVLFDESGRAVAHFAAYPGNPAALPTLQQWLLMNGVY